MDQSCADNFHAAFEEFKADGGKVEGVVEWVSDADLAKQVRICLVFFFLILSFQLSTLYASHHFLSPLLSHCSAFSTIYLL